ncbi:Holliday junction branch migration protein RuvA [Haliangium sp.]|uniref:Holliday junction branch migration protein RuvA n=1 Tax=Haliangium sp. TaxID=2663208 RepID=UPI003D0FC00A
MIGRLSGTLAEQDDTTVIVDCGGVGYLVTVSVYTLMSLPPAGEPVTLRVFTQAQENKIALFGFASALERDLFDLLITVKKVGPSSAMGILSAGPTPAEIAAMIAREDTAQLTRLRGVGKKTAEMLVVELREKCELLLATWEASGQPRPVAAAGAGPGRGRPAVLDEVAQALAQLGWRSAEAERVVGELEVGEGATLESLLRQALRSMPR